MVTVSCIIPVKNGGKWLAECLDSILLFENPPNVWLQVSVYNDGSKDDTKDILEGYRHLFLVKKIDYIVTHAADSKGVGFAKNRAVAQSSGEFLCFCDADDVFLICRIKVQLHAALQCGNCSLAFIGGKFKRIPEDSTERYTRWANSLTSSQLLNQAYTSYGPTLVAPTWFISRKLYNAIGGFNESYAVGYPEDLKFFYDAIKLGAKFVRVDDYVTIYRYHPNCASHKVDEMKIWLLRVEEISENVIAHWKQFTIWNAGKQGKRFFKSLSPCNRKKVVAFCDVDFKKIERGYFEQFDIQTRSVIAKVPILPVSAAVPPVIICVKMDLTAGVFEHLLAQKNWCEGVDYFHFS